MAQRKFDYTIDFKTTDFRKHPDKYIIGKGEQGVLLIEPYKSELLPFWKFKTPAIARQSAEKLFSMFKEYKASAEFVGMDMARKFIQMGYTRARRYANHSSGKKYKGPVPLEYKGQSGAHGRELLPLEPDNEKAHTAKIFYDILQKINEDAVYISAKETHKKMKIDSINESKKMK